MESLALIGCSNTPFRLPLLALRLWWLKAGARLPAIRLRLALTLSLALVPPRGTSLVGDAWPGRFA